MLQRFGLRSIPGRPAEAARNKKTKHPPVSEGCFRSIPIGYNASEANAEGGNRTLIPVGNTILSRARLPIPPLRLVG